MESDRRLATVAARQHGLLTRSQLRDSGFTDRAIDSRTEAGRLERVHRGVYRVAGSVGTFEQQVLAACLSLGGVVAASHRAAAELWGLELPDAPVCEVTRTSGRSARLPGVVVHRGIDLVPGHIVRRRGIPVTNPLRLLVDLGAVVPAFAVEHVLDDLVGRRAVTLSGVRAFHESVAARGRSGCGVLREILDRRTAGDEMGRSRLEAMLISLADRAGLPMPVFQYPIVLSGRNRRIDFAFPTLRIAIEVDGYESHTRYDIFQDDRVRGNELELAGWMVLHFTWHHLRHRPAYVVGVLRDALELASAA